VPAEVDAVEAEAASDRDVTFIVAAAAKLAAPTAKAATRTMTYENFMACPCPLGERGPGWGPSLAGGN